MVAFESKSLPFVCIGPFRSVKGFNTIRGMGGMFNLNYYLVHRIIPITEKLKYNNIFIYEVLYIKVLFCKAEREFMRRKGQRNWTNTKQHTGNSCNKNDVMIARSDTKDSKKDETCYRFTAVLMLAVALKETRTSDLLLTVQITARNGDNSLSLFFLNQLLAVHICDAFFKIRPLFLGIRF